MHANGTKMQCPLASPTPFTPASPLPPCLPQLLTNPAGPWNLQARVVAGPAQGFPILDNVQWRWSQLSIATTVLPAQQGRQVRVLVNNQAVLPGGFRRIPNGSVTYTVMVSCGAPALACGQRWRGACS